MSAGEKIVLAIDPGNSKCGLALVLRKGDGQLELLWRGISPTERLFEAITEAKTHGEFSMMIVGSGTSSHDLVRRLREQMPSVGILVVDERDTSIQARERYWEHNPRRGWRRILPATLQVPPTPIDDFAALILAERVLVE